MSFIRTSSGDYFSIIKLHQNLVYWKIFVVKIGIYTKSFRILITSLRQNFHHRTHIQQSYPKGNSKKNVNITFPILFTIQFHFNCYISQVSHIKCQVLVLFHRPISFAITFR